MKFLTLILAVACFSLANADVNTPPLINYQGRLTDALGAPLADGTHSLQFNIWRHATSSDPSQLLWSSGPVSVSTSNGLFKVVLGASPQPILNPTDFQDGERWLGIQIGANPELTPRSRLISTPYAFSSEQANTAMNAPNHLPLVGGTMTGNTIHNNAGSRWNNLYGAVEIWQGYPFFSTFGDDGEEQIRLWGESWGELQLHDYTGNQVTVALGATSYNWPYDDGGLLSLNKNDGTPGAILRGGSTNDGSELAMRRTDGSLSVVIDTDIDGDGSVQFPADAINSIELSNEPGLVSSFDATVFNYLPNTGEAKDIATVTITIPTDGYILVEGRGYGITMGTTSWNLGVIQIDETSGGGPGDFQHITAFGSTNSTSVDEQRLWPYYVDRIYFKNSGTHTFILEGLQDAFNAPEAQTIAVRSWLRATYIPSSYGSVVTSSPLPESIGAKASFDPTITYAEPARIDLRELELKAAKLRADAESAERAVLEAKLASLRSKDSNQKQQVEQK